MDLGNILGENLFWNGHNTRKEKVTDGMFQMEEHVKNLVLKKEIFVTHFHHPMVIN